MSEKYLIVIMGVSGSGKTTIAKHIAENRPLKYMESDQFHSEANKLHMQSGLPLTDEMRRPWIEAICTEIGNEPNHIVLANSGLKKAHRARFTQLNKICHFINLQVPKEIIQARLHVREDHFMPASLLDSQFEAMEAKSPTEPIIDIDGRGSISDVADACLRRVDDILRGGINAGVIG